MNCELWTQGFLFTSPFSDVPLTAACLDPGNLLSKRARFSSFSLHMQGGAVVGKVESAHVDFPRE